MFAAQGLFPCEEQPPHGEHDDERRRGHPQQRRIGMTVTGLPVTGLPEGHRTRQQGFTEHDQVQQSVAFNNVMLVPRRLMTLLGDGGNRNFMHHA